MKSYICTNAVKAQPMTKGEAFNRSLLQGNITDADRETPGYIILYPNGHESWVQAEVFERVYRLAETPLDRINLEYQDLDNKAGAIVQFKASDKFSSLREVDRAGLDAQFDTMVAYLGLLGLRATSMETGKGGLSGFNFGVAISLLKHGYVIRRSGWNGKDIVVFKQVPASINADIIPNMQSLPGRAKEIILDGSKHIDYTSQCLIYNTKTGRADSWVPSISDVFAEDWELVSE